MRMRYFSILIVVLAVIGTAGMVQAGLVTYTFSGTVLDGPFEGSIGTGSFSYNRDLIIEGNEVLNVANGLTVAFSFGGQAFDATHDVDYDEFPELEFYDGMPVFLDYQLVDGWSDVDFDDPNLLGLGLGELNSSVGDFDYEVELFAEAVPIPGAIWLLGSGIVCLIGLGRKTTDKV